MPVVRRRFVWLVPALWVLTALLGFQSPGDEYSLFAVGSLAGIWICLLIGDAGSPAELLPPILVAGGLTMAVLGLLLDRLRAPLVLWTMLLLGGAAVAGFYLVTSFSDLDAAVAKNGSLSAYLFCSVQLGNYGATLFTIGFCALGIRPPTVATDGA